MLSIYVSPGAGTRWRSWRVRLARRAANDVAHCRVRGGRIVVRWRGEAMMRQCSAVPSSYVAVADRGGAPGSGEAWFHSGFLLLLASPSSLSLDLSRCGAMPPAAATNGLRVRVHGRWLL